MINLYVVQNQCAYKSPVKLNLPKAGSARLSKKSVFQWRLIQLDIWPKVIEYTQQNQKTLCDRIQQITRRQVVKGKEN